METQIQLINFCASFLIRLMRCNTGGQHNYSKMIFLLCTLEWIVALPSVYVEFCNIGKVSIL